MTYIQQFLQDIIGQVPSGYEYLEYVFSFLILAGIIAIASFIIVFPFNFIRRIFHK